jgi:nucleoside-diphosphate-sugar epimerase
MTQLNPNPPGNQKQNLCVLITGATGFVGRRLTEYLLSQYPDIHLRLAVRKPIGNDPINLVSRPQVHYEVVGDINPQTDWSDALNGVDVVIHLAARVHVMQDHASDPLQEYRQANTASSIHLAQAAAKAGVKRFIYLSSIKVNGEATNSGRPFSEDSLPAPMDPYGVSKWEAELGIEKICLQTGMEFVVIRPPLIYGPGVSANFKKLMQLVAKGLPLPLGAIHNQRSMLALDNLISFIDVAISHPEAANQRFLLSDGQDLSTTQLLKLLAKGLQRDVWLLPIPSALLNIAAKVVGQSAASERLLGSLQIDSSKARQLLQWNPPLSVEEGIALTAEHYLQQVSKLH